MCEEALSGKPKVYSRYVEGDLNKEIDTCYFEEKENQTNFMTKRWFDCANFVTEIIDLFSGSGVSRIYGKV